MNNNKNYIKNAGIILFGLLIIAFIVLKFGIGNILDSLSRANGILVLFATCIYFLGIFTRSFKLNKLLKVVGCSINILEFLPFYLINGMISNITPFRSGDAYFPFLINKYFKTKIGRGFSIIIIDRIIEMFTLIFMMLVSATLLYNKSTLPKQLKNVGSVSILILFIIIIILLIFIFNETLTLGLLERIEKKIKNEKFIRFTKRINIEIKEFYFIKKEIGIKIVAKQVILTFLAWICDYLSFYVVLNSIFYINIFDSIISQTASTGFSLVSFMPAGLGASELSYVYFGHLFGYSISNITAGALLSRFAFLGLIFISGYISLNFVKCKYK